MITSLQYNHRFTNYQYEQFYRLHHALERQFLSGSPDEELCLRLEARLAELPDRECPSDEGEAGCCAPTPGLYLLPSGEYSTHAG